VCPFQAGAVALKREVAMKRDNVLAVLPSILDSVIATAMSRPYEARDDSLAVAAVAVDTWADEFRDFHDMLNESQLELVDKFASGVAEAVCRFIAPEAPTHCPVCGGKTLVVERRVWEYMTFEGKMVSWDEDEEVPPRFHCRNCSHQWKLEDPEILSKVRGRRKVDAVAEVLVPDR
jgi:hypothetical protein